MARTGAVCVPLSRCEYWLTQDPLFAEEKFEHRRRCDWFKALFGFSEQSFETTKSKFIIENKDGTTILRSKCSDREYKVGKFHTPTLSELRNDVNQSEAVLSMKSERPALSIDFVYGDVSEIHADVEYRYATFQAASQFNCLEFAGPNLTPEDGISGYVDDKTQGPACSIACGPGTAYRNYLHKWTDRDGTNMVTILA